jgi:hypothetical protein
VSVCQPEPVIHRVRQVLLCTEVVHGGPDRLVTKEQPDLFGVAARFAAQAVAGAPQVPGGEIPQIEIARIFAHNPPHGIVGQPFFSDLAGFVDRTEQRPRPDTGGSEPVVEEKFYPGGDRYCPKPFPFPTRYGSTQRPARC